MLKHSILPIAILLLLGSGCAARPAAVQARLAAHVSNASIRLLVENHTNANLEIYAIPESTRTWHRLGEVRSNRRASLPVPAGLMSETDPVYLIAVAVDALGQLGVPTEQRTLVHSEPLELRPGQQVVWQLTGINAPRVSAVRVF